MQRKNRIHEAFALKIGDRNPSYWGSVSLGLKAAVGFAPTTLFRSMKAPVLGACMGVFLAVMTLLVWFWTRILILLAGALGHLTENVSKD